MTEKNRSALYIAEECRKAGMTLAGAAGVLANIEAESVFKSTNLQDSFNNSFNVSDDDYTAQVDRGIRNFIDDAGYGLCQWTAGSRKRMMQSFHKMRCKSIGDFQTQVDFMLSEISGYNRAWVSCTSSNDPFECGYNVCRYYEIPADTENQANYRGNRARYWYQWLADHSDVEVSMPSTSAPVSQTPVEQKNVVVGKMKLRNIDKGIKGWPEVWLLQSALKTRGYNVVCDGNFGDELDKKLRQFQKDASLSVDGVVGPMTWAAVLNFG